MTNDALSDDSHATQFGHFFGSAQAAQRVCHHQCRHARGVGFQEDGFAAPLTHQGHGLFAATAVRVRHHHSGSFASPHLRHRSPDARRGTGDQRNFVFQDDSVLFCPGRSNRVSRFGQGPVGMGQ
jgi:hypothetical protein